MSKDTPESKNAARPAAADVQSKLQQAFAFHQQGQFARAQGLYEDILKIEPAHVGALHLLGVVAAQTGNFQAAAELIGKAVAISPNFAEAHGNLGNALHGLRQFNAALASYDKAIALKADHVEAYYNRGNVLRELKQTEAAVASYDTAIGLNPGHVEAHFNRAIALQDLRRFDAALAGYDRVVALRPEHADAWNNRGNALRDLRRFHEALASYDRAIALGPDNAEAHNNRGNALRDLRRLDEALAGYEKAIALRPGYAAAYNNRGNVLREIRQLDGASARVDAALASYDKAIALQPDCADFYNNRANLLKDLKRFDAALADYDKAIALKPDYDCLFGMRLHTRMQVCEWGGFDQALAELSEMIMRAEDASPPFAVLALSDSLPLQRKAAETWVQHKCPVSQSLPRIAGHPRHEKLRIGYFSMNFGDHPVTHLAAELFETHDRARFEIHGFSYGPDARDDFRKRVQAGFDRFFDVQGESDRDVALLSRRHEIDIAVDLGGITADSRPGIFAMRAAPVQVSYLGYLGTMGAEYIDYLVADRTIIPPDHRKYYSEKIAYLPSYQPNDSRRRIADHTPTRQELGLPPAGFVFCCFNNNYKITPRTFDGWMRILGRVEGSVLFLYADNDRAETNLRKEAALRGVDADRIVFGKRLAMPDYLARYRAADLFLDTLPYNAGATASDALWAGLPVLTCAGEAFAGRVAASLLNAVELPELVASTQEQYEALAVELATNPGRLDEIRRKLATNRLTTALFDTRLFTRRLEAAYAQMAGRYHADLPCDHIYIDHDAA